MACTPSRRRSSSPEPSPPSHFCSRFTSLYTSRIPIRLVRSFSPYVNRIEIAAANLLPGSDPQPFVRHARKHFRVSCFLYPRDPIFPSARIPAELPFLWGTELDSRDDAAAPDLCLMPSRDSRILRGFGDLCRSIRGGTEIAGGFNLPPFLTTKKGL